MTTKALTFSLDVPVPLVPIFSAATPDDRIVVKVEADGDIFDCTVTLDGKTVLEQLRTEDQNKMLSWTKRQMVEAMRRCSKA